jgi:hypothetical protein
MLERGLRPMRRFLILAALPLGACAPPDVGLVHPTPVGAPPPMGAPPTPQAVPTAAFAGKETIEQDKAWAEQLKRGACMHLRDARTDSPADIAECDRQYSQQPLCVSYRGYAGIWFDMSVNPPNPRVNWFAFEADMIDRLGNRGKPTDPPYFRSPQYRETLRRLLNVAFSPDRSRWKNADQFGEVAYKMCLEGHPF